METRWRHQWRHHILTKLYSDWIILFSYEYTVGIAEFVYDLVTRYGVAEIVMSDQGREFVNEVNQNLFQLCGTDHRIYPQTNSLDERMNLTLKGALVKFVNENQDDWDVHIKSCLSNKQKRFYQLYAFWADVWSCSNFADRNGDCFTPQAPWWRFACPPVKPLRFSRKMAIRQKVKAKAMKNIDKAQERQKKSWCKASAAIL